MSGGKATPLEGLVVLAGVVLILAGGFGVGLGLLRLAGPWGPIAAGLGLMVLGVAILVVVLAAMRSRKPRGGQVDGTWWGGGPQH